MEDTNGLSVGLINIPQLDEINSANDVRSIPNFDLQIVLAQYDKKNQLENCDRVVVANSIIKYVLLQNMCRT